MMEKFELDKAKGVLKSCNTSKKKGKDEGKLVLNNDVKLMIVVDKRCEKAVDFLFPAYASVENEIASRDGSHPGIEFQTKGDTPELNVTVFDGTGQNEVWSFERIELQGKPKLLINSLGDSRLVLRLNARLSKKDMSKLVDYIEADVYVSATVSQPLLPGLKAGKEVSEALEAVHPIGERKGKSNGKALQQNLDGSMSHDELRTFREDAGWSRPDMILELDNAGVSVSARSLARYEAPPDDGGRAIPEQLANAVKAMQLESFASA